MRKITISIPIFDQEVTVIWGNTIESVFQYLADTEGYINKNLSVEASTVDYEDGRIFICLTPETQDKIIVHECVHAVYSLINLLGISLEDEEVFAYLLEFLYGEIKKHV